MAIGKRLKRRTSTGTEILHPETVLAKVRKNLAGDARSAFSDNLLKITPSALGKSIIKVAPITGAITRINADNALLDEDLQLVSGDYHSHALGDVGSLEATLNEALESKVPLNGSTVADAYFPDFVRSTMRYQGTCELTETPVLISSIFSELMGLSTAADIIKCIGYYYLVEVGGFVVADGAAGGIEIIHEDTDGPVELSAGSRIVFVDYDEVEEIYWFAFMATGLKHATSDTPGTVRLLPEIGPTKRVDLENNSLRVVDEATVRKVLRDVVYKGNIVQLPLPMDFLDYYYTTKVFIICGDAVYDDLTETSGVITRTHAFGLKISTLGSVPDTAGPYIITSAKKVYIPYYPDPSGEPGVIQFSYIGTESGYPTPSGLFNNQICYGQLGTTVRYYILKQCGRETIDTDIWDEYAPGGSFGTMFVGIYTEFCEGDLIID